MKIQSFGDTHIGRVRSSNQDAIIAEEALGLFGVADGIGGLPDGAFASSRALDLIRHNCEVNASGEASDLAWVVRAANRQLYEEGRHRHPATGVGTTLTLASLSEEQMIIAHAGDSCAMLLRGTDFRRLTREHTVAAEIQGRPVAVPDESLHERSFHTLTRCLGESEEVDLDLLKVQIRTGDRFLFATDGLTKVCQRLELQAHLTDALSARDAVIRLMRAVLARGAPDNVGLVAVFVS
ncbi:MAG: serine/threonine-protein phosphatase [Opitutales bacterium]|nr:serine/threonine-protein phosphatase [Opitutales bacterium]